MNFYRVLWFVAFSVVKDLTTFTTYFERWKVALILNFLDGRNKVPSKESSAFFRQLYPHRNPQSQFVRYPRCGQGDRTTWRSEFGGGLFPDLDIWNREIPSYIGRANLFMQLSDPGRSAPKDGTAPYLIALRLRQWLLN